MVEETDRMAFESRERHHVQTAITKSRQDALASAVDELASRLADCEQLIAEGGYTYERAFTTMIKPQIERVVVAKNRFMERP